MPTEPEIKYGVRHRCFTSEELKAIGLDGAQYHEEWTNPNVVDVSPTVNSHGPAYVVTFRYEDSFWAVTVGYSHEDWDSNDLLQRSSLEAVEVEPHTKKSTVYREKRVTS